METPKGVMAVSIDNTEPTTKTYKACIKCGHLADVEIIDSYVSSPTITDQQIEIAAQAILNQDELGRILDKSNCASWYRCAAKAALTAALGVESE